MTNQTDNLTPETDEKLEEVFNNELGYFDVEIVSAFISAFGGHEHYDSLEKFVESFQDSYQGTYSSQEEFAETICTELGYVDLSEMEWWISNAIDWQKVADNLSDDYTYVYDSNYRNVHVFHAYF